MYNIKYAYDIVEFGDSRIEIENIRRIIVQVVDEVCVKSTNIYSPKIRGAWERSVKIRIAKARSVYP